MLKKVLKGILLVLFIVLSPIGLLKGKGYIESKRIEHIVKSDDGKEAIENMLRGIDDKALTPEGKIKSYKIEFDKVKRNPMGGISIYLIINDDKKFELDMTFQENSTTGEYETGGYGMSPEFNELIRGEK